jgi:hypothetical protein
MIKQKKLKSKTWPVVVGNIYPKRGGLSSRNYVWVVVSLTDKNGCRVLGVHKDTGEIMNGCHYGVWAFETIKPIGFCPTVVNAKLLLEFSDE